MDFSKEKLWALAAKWWPVLALIVIFLFSYYIRSVNNTPDRMLSFDPIFQYRFTEYFANWHTLPAWDELSYYTGRPIFVSDYPPFMWYLTSLIYWFVKGFGYSLMTTATSAAAFYGALITIPAFLLGRELSNKWGGLLSATLMGSAPQILIRTFGASYDNDQLVVFFILLTLFLAVYAMRRRTPASIFAAVGGFTAFMLTWGTFAYSILILAAFIGIHFVVETVLPRGEEKPIKSRLNERLATALSGLKKQLGVIITIVAGLIVTGFLAAASPIKSIMDVMGFAQAAERWIVNVSIAELQPFNIFRIDGWMLSMGRFVTGESVIDTALLVVFMSLMIFGLWRGYKRGNFDFALLLTLFGIGIYTTFRGIRFTEFTSALFIIIIGTGFGYLVEWSSKKDSFVKSFSLGLGLLIALLALGIGLQIAPQLGPDIDPNWDNAWNFLKTSTPELSLVGTWWDPGHMITGTAERRVIADGGHCKEPCLYNINDRITDLGKIMATNDENESVNLIKKYQGTSPKVYWIASNDLIGKYQWLQYFGTGCNAYTDSRCQLYGMLSLGQVAYNQNGSIAVRFYPASNLNVITIDSQIPIPLLIEDNNAALFSEVIYYDNGMPVSVRFDNINTTEFIASLKPLADQLKVRMVNQTIQQTLWIPSGQQYVVMIPPNLRNTVFTRMFMLEGRGLEHFKQVYRNEDVKIYEVV